MKKFVFLLFLILSIGLIEGVDWLHKAQSETKKLVHSKPNDLIPSLTKVLAEPAATIGRSAKLGTGAKENTQFFSRVFDSISDANFKKIKVDPEVARNEIDFWARQVSEHALFAHLGFEDPNLKNRALTIHQELEKFRAKFNKNPNDIAHMNTLLPLLKVERKLQIEGLKAMESGNWVGWFFPSYFNHVTLEVDYFIDKLNGIKYSPQDEVAFFNRINGEHAAFTTHFLDPVERKLMLQSDEASHKFMNIPKNEKEMMIKLSLAAAKELDEFNRTAQANSKNIKSVIHPVLLDHMIREGERSIKTLENLGLHKEAQVIADQHAEDMKSYTLS